MNEAEFLPACLSCIEKQTYKNINVVVCVNQPEKFRNDPEKKHICENNARTIESLNVFSKLPLTVIDRSSENKGWKGKKHGVGWARKTVMDYISSVAAADDIMISMDADTVFNPFFCESILKNIHKHRKAVALALPYYHRLKGDEKIDRALLRYEIYVRYYAVNLWRIKNPYCFTAIGSSMALPVWAYRAVRGIAPKLSGEDFYFLQKLRKFGSIIVWSEESTYPANRYSDRVFFGTGPALIKGAENDWQSYPMYSYQLFDQVKDTYDAFDKLFSEDLETPMSSFLSETFPDENIWQPLRDNFTNREKFVKACTEKIDGLRILQYLKSKQKVTGNDAVFVSAYLKKFHRQELTALDFDINELNFENSSIEELNILRELLAQIENSYRKKFIVIDWW
ncbi:MAG TPA: hypothetical protein PKW80_08375 [Bacteroidales bacterium]|nr:hypothetical protein [Bacteroidales bacterium]